MQLHLLAWWSSGVFGGVGSKLVRSSLLIFGMNMSDETTLTVIEQREIGFYEDRISALKVEDGTIYVPLRPICELIGVDWAGQARKLNNDPVLSEVSASVDLTLRVSDARQTIRTTMRCLPLDFLNGWLFGINANRVKAEIRPKLIQYQREVYRVLFDAFGQNMVTAAAEPLVDELLANDNPAVIAYRQAMAVANLARQQMVMEARLVSAESQLTDIESRLQIVEANQGDDSRYITNAQAVQVAQGVKQIALELGKRSGRNEFGGVYGELHRRFEIPSYKQLPTAQFSEAMTFLRGWWESLTDSADAPF